MSEQATEAPGTEGAPEAVELAPFGDAAFATLMDTLAPEPEAGSVPAGAAPAEPAAAGDGPAAAPAQAPGAEAPPAAEGGAGDGGKPAVPTAGDPAPGQPATGEPAAAGDPVVSDRGDRPADWTADAASFVPKLSEISTKFEEVTAARYQDEALKAVREDFPEYFEHVQKHPRLLVGTQVNRINGEGKETLRDSEDAKEWQEAVKGLLVDEVRARAGKAMESDSEALNTVHSSIELFQNNLDLIPGTKDFDTELAKRFTELAEPYELRVDGKLHGYNLPVQPLINQIRNQLVAERAAKTAAPPPAPAAGAGAPASTPGAPAKAEEPPQAGVPSKAGSSAEVEDFSTLFGTIGLPNIRI